MRRCGTARIFRYEIRRWFEGSIPDLWMPRWRAPCGCPTTCPSHATRCSTRSRPCRLLSGAATSSTPARCGTRTASSRGCSLEAVLDTGGHRSSSSPVAHPAGMRASWRPPAQTADADNADAYRSEMNPFSNGIRVEIPGNPAEASTTAAMPFVVATRQQRHARRRAQRGRVEVRELHPAIRDAAHVRHLDRTAEHVHRGVPDVIPREKTGRSVHPWAPWAQGTAPSQNRIPDVERDLGR